MLLVKDLNIAGIKHIHLYRIASIFRGFGKFNVKRKEQIR
jgi:hypothetical protein